MKPPSHLARAACRRQGQLAAFALSAALASPCVMAAKPAPDCDQFDIDATQSKSLGDGGERPDICRVRFKDGIPLPDRRCTPGAVNPTLTSAVLRNPDFRTSCVRDNATSASEKSKTYTWYQLPHPKDNRGVKQVCELDHLISLELGGADALDNIWPQCGPSRVVLRNRYFKKKDAVENYLARRVKDGSMKLKDAQQRIAEDWTQFLEEALGECSSGSKCEESRID